MKKSDYSTCPYNDLPDRAFFRNLHQNGEALIGASHSKMKLTSADKVMSAGSCFAARIASTIRSSNVTYLFSDDILVDDPQKVKEESPSFFSLRYGNIYTTRHLQQLLERAIGSHDEVQPPATQDPTGRYRNLLRPTGLSYDSLDTLAADDQNHLSNMRTMLERASVFIFTLGLTEQWIDKYTGLTLPAAPGCGYGEYDTNKFEFHNASRQDVLDELTQSLKLMRTVNPSISLILTLSPVPLVATFTQASALEATFFSKSLLRQAIHEFITDKAKGDQRVDYFPSYEIVTNPYRLEEHFTEDRRTITDLAVQRVMGRFEALYLQEADLLSPVAIKVESSELPTVVEENKVDPVCEEENIWSVYLHKQGTVND